MDTDTNLGEKVNEDKGLSKRKVAKRPSKKTIVEIPIPSFPGCPVVIAINGTRESPIHTLYIGRSWSMGGWSLPKSKWANPFRVSQFSSSELCLQAYEDHIRKSNLINDIHELKGHVLGCWCKPKSCHGDVLVKLYIEKYHSNPL